MNSDGVVSNMELKTKGLLENHKEIYIKITTLLKSITIFDLLLGMWCESEQKKTA